MNKNQQPDIAHNDVDTRIDAYLHSNDIPEQGNNREQQLTRRLQRYCQLPQAYELALKRVQVRLEHAQLARGASSELTQRRLAPSLPRPGQFKVPYLEARSRFSRRWSLLAAVTLTVLLLSGALMVLHQVNVQTISTTDHPQKTNLPTVQPNLPPQLYAVSSDLGDLQFAFTLYQIDPASGQIAWHFGIKPQMSGLQSFSMPLAANGLLYVQTTDTPGMTIFALNPKNGTLLWKTLLGGNGGGKMVFAHGLLYVVKALDNRALIFALNAQNGHILWQQSYQDSVGVGFDNTLQVVGSAGTTLYAIDYQFAQSNSMLYALNAQTGAQIWQKEISHPEKITEAQMVGTTIYLAGMSSTHADAQDQTSIYAYDASTGDQSWSTKIIGQVSQLLLENKTLYASTAIKNNAGQLLPGSLYVLQTGNGQILWQKNFHQVIDGMLVANGEVYLNLDNGISQLFEAFRGNNGSLDWHQTRTNGIGGLGFLGTDLYFASAHKIDVLDGSSGILVKTFSIPNTGQNLLALPIELFTA